MTVERALRLMAGLVVLVSVALATWVHPGWIFLTAFVGLNLLQSAFTNWCPAVWIFQRFGLERCDAPPAPRRSSAGGNHPVTS